MRSGESSLIVYDNITQQRKGIVFEDIGETMGNVGLSIRVVQSFPRFLPLSISFDG